MFLLALTPSCPLSLLVLSLQTSHWNYSDHRILVKFTFTVHRSISWDLLKKKTQINVFLDITLFAIMKRNHSALIIK